MKKHFQVKDNYLLIPVKTGNQTKTISIYHGDKKIFEFEVPYAENQDVYEYDYLAEVPVQNWKDSEIVIEAEVSESFYEQIRFSSAFPLNKEIKPLIHFSANYGWMNDPSGLIYQNGLYHLYYQHNPFDIEWGNMSWGHAVSRDLIHWEHREEALLPDEEGTIFTGSAIVNKQGLFNLPEDAQIYVYTSAGGSSKWSEGKEFVQRVAYSTDNGNTFQKMEGHIIGHMIGGNRDVKVYWHEERQIYYAVMFLDGHDYAILNSKDFVNWEITQKLNLDPAWECPDLVQVPVEGGGSKWVFWTGDGFYYIGDFDGSNFVSDFVLHEAYHTLLPYAAQTFAGTERIISIPWIRTNNKGKLYRSLMGIPRQFTLVKNEDSYRLRMKIVDEFENQKETIVKKSLNAVEMETGLAELSYEKNAESAIELLVSPGKNSGFLADIYGTKICLNGNHLFIEGVAERSNGVKDAAKLYEKEEIQEEKQNCRKLELDIIPEKISIISDGEVLEITVNDGLYADVYETVIDSKKGFIKIETDGMAELMINEIK